MPKLSLTKWVLAGIGLVAAGILTFFGEKIGETIWNVTLPTTPNQGLPFLDWVTIGTIVIGILAIIYGVHAMRKRQEPKLVPISSSELDVAQQSYETILSFKISSSTDWFGVGVVDSKGVNILAFRAPEGTDIHFKEIPDPNLSYFRVDQKQSCEMLVDTVFDSHPGDQLIVFLRKGDYGNLKVEAFDWNRKHLGGHEYKGTNQRWNYCEFKIKYT